MATKMNAGFAAMMEKKKGGADALAKHAAKPAAEAHKGLTAKGKPFAKGGGIEIKGKTKGAMVKMCSGGMTKKK